MNVSRTDPLADSSESAEELQLTRRERSRRAEHPAQDGDGPVVRVESLVKHFRRGDGTIVRAIDDVALEVNPGEFVVLLGPSGCGKTTLLRSIAGLEEPDHGVIEVHGRRHYSSTERINLAPQHRKLGMIFQSYALWPHLTAFKNVAYPLSRGQDGKLTRSQIAERVHRVLEMVGIPELAGQYPNQMSGGQQQRVALARALVAGNDLVLFDEPLSNVDAKVREALRAELASMQRQLGFAALYVTHDQVEAMELASRIAVLNHGRVAQLGRPRDIYERPTSRYVANFIGTTNEILGVVETTSPEGEVTVQTDLGRVHGVAGVDSLRPGNQVVALFRPERAAIGLAEGAAVNRWRGRVEASIFGGSHTEHVVWIGDHKLRLWQASSELFTDGDDVWVEVEAPCVRVLPADTDADFDQLADEAEPADDSRPLDTPLAMPSG